MSVPQYTLRLIAPAAALAQLLDLHPEPELIKHSLQVYGVQSTPRLHVLSARVPGPEELGLVLRSLARPQFRQALSTLHLESMPMGEAERVRLARRRADADVTTHHLGRAVPRDASLDAPPPLRRPVEREVPWPARPLAPDGLAATPGARAGRAAAAGVSPPADGVEGLMSDWPPCSPDRTLVVAR